VPESDPEVSERLRFCSMRRLREKNRGEVAHAG
jgi:hypothetical protein